MDPIVSGELISWLLGNNGPDMLITIGDSIDAPWAFDTLLSLEENDGDWEVDNVY